VLSGDNLQIKLSTKSFGTEAASVAASAIANCAATLTHADLSDVIAGRPEAEALDALRILSNALAQVQMYAELSECQSWEKRHAGCLGMKSWLGMQADRSIQRCSSQLLYRVMHQTLHMNRTGLGLANAQAVCCENVQDRSCRKPVWCA